MAATVTTAPAVAVTSRDVLFDDKYEAIAREGWGGDHNLRGAELPLAGGGDGYRAAG